MLPMIAYCTPDPYAFSVCKHILYWKGLFDSPLVRPPYANAPTWLQRELRELAQQLGLLDGALNPRLPYAPTAPPGPGRAVCASNPTVCPPQEGKVQTLICRRIADKYASTSREGTVSMKTIIPRALTPGRLAIFAALLSLSMTATAQTTGTIEGTVVDANGFSLPGVLVTATGSGVREESVTDVAGSYGFAGLAAGDYLVTATLPGFDPVERRVSVGAGATETVPLVLQVPLLLDTLSVVADKPPDFRAQRRSRADDPAAVEHHQRRRGGGQPPRRIHPGGGRVRVRRLVEQCRRARLPGDHQRGADRHHRRRLSERHLRLLQRRQSEPVHRPDEPRRVEVSQGTADIASRSVEALGGTFNYRTDDPAAERTYTASTTLGENDGKRFSMRVDTGPLFGGETRAWIAAVRQEATDWVQGSARNEREHIAAKMVSPRGRLDLTGYLSYDDIHEDTYQRIYG